MRMCNPSIRRWEAKSGRGELAVEVNPATYKGVYGKTALLGGITMVVAVLVELLMFNAILNENYDFVVWASIAAGICFVPMIILSLVMAFAPRTTKYLSIPYAVMQGGLLGAVALFVDIFYPGIALAAFLGTMIVFVISVAVNKLLEVRISSRFIRGLMIAFFSLLLVQLVMFLLSVFNVFNTTDGWEVFNWIQLAISAFCIIWATLMITYDIKSIDMCVQNGCDKRYEWNLAFSLLTTLVYLYIEILELLVRILILIGRNKK